MLFVVFVGHLLSKQIKQGYKKDDECQVVPLHYCIGENRMTVETRLTEDEANKMSEFRKQNPKKWEDNDLELLKHVRKIIEEEQNNIIESEKQEIMQEEKNGEMTNNEKAQGGCIDEDSSNDETTEKTNTDRDYSSTIECDNRSKTKTQKGIRVLLAIVVCVVLFLLFGLLAASMEWKHGGGAIVMFLFLSFVAFVWRKILGKKENPGENFKVSLHNGVGKERFDFEVMLTQDEILQMSKVRGQNPEKWKDNEYELVKIIIPDFRIEELEKRGKNVQINQLDDTAQTIKLRQDGIEVSMSLPTNVIEQMELLKKQDPQRWNDNEVELVKEAKRLLNEQMIQEDIQEEQETPIETDNEEVVSNQESVFMETANENVESFAKTQIPNEGTLSQNEDSLKQEQIVAEDVSASKTTNPEKRKPERLSKVLKTLLIVILSIGILFGLYVLGSFIYTKYIYPSKAKQNDEKLLIEAKANPSKAYDIAQELFYRVENGHKSDYHDLISGKQGICDFDHSAVGMEAVNIYCQYCIDSAKNDISHSNKIAGMLFRKSNSYCEDLCNKTGVEILKYAANEGDPNAQLALGGYYDGFRYNKADDEFYIDDNYTIDGKNKDLSKAAYWYLQAANQGNTAAMGDLGIAYMYGKGVRKDEKVGLEWVQKAAKLDDAWFQRVLGDYYRDGIVIEVGNHKVVTGYYWEWDYDEYGNFGNHKHTKTKTVTDYKTILAKDIKQAQYWWKKAADNGDETAKERLQQIFE